ncbi:hypothetical protein FJY63_10375 [Candidatus Sumerlaeota bacterium]|nr:hypothetical protein [Candidatus Sumerlaeota bacterium]
MRCSIAVVAAVGLTAAVACRLQLWPSPQRADNSLCYVCHADFTSEAIVVTHARRAIGCDRCHGPSDPHMSNEDNVIAPDVMFERAQVNWLCTVCHARLKSSHQTIEIGATDRGKVCTDCHGHHRVDQPRRRWDKRTRQLL